MSRPHRLLCLVVLALAALCAGAPAAIAGNANAGLPGAWRSNPLGGITWGNYSGVREAVLPNYLSASGATKTLLGRIEFEPRTQWYGDWVNDPANQLREYIENVTANNPDALVQMAIFRLHPWEGQACHRLPTAGDRSSYRRWIDTAADTIGNETRVALILQPDLPIAGCVPRRSLVYMREVAYAARRFSALAHTTVYIDGGSSDWATVGNAATELRQAGVRYARGFALDITHYASTGDQIRYGAAVARSLARAGLRGKHFVVNTSSNGRPFTYQQFTDVFNNGTPCATRYSQHCVTLGIPPTLDVASPRWGLSPGTRSLARRLVDAYMWIGRPWLDHQAYPFDLKLALQLALTTPYQ